MAKEHPRYAEMEWPDFEFSEYPKMIYPPTGSDASTPALRNRKANGVIVNNPQEEAWVHEGGAIVREGDEKAELQATCDRMGVQYDKRWGVSRLKEEIAKAEQEAME